MTDEHEHDERPQEVELLLDRERPQVHEQLRRGRGEVVGAGADLEPVRREGDGAEHLAPDADEQVALAEPGEQHGCRDAHEERRQQPAGAAGPEAGQVDAVPVARRSRTSSVVMRKPGDDEEDVDPEEAAGQPRRVEVEDEHGGDGQGAQAVEAGEAAGPGRRPGRRHPPSPPGRLRSPAGGAAGPGAP